MSKTSAAAKDRYNAKAYDQILVRVKKGDKAKIQACAKGCGLTTNGYINMMIFKGMGGLD